VAEAALDLLAEALATAQLPALGDMMGMLGKDATRRSRHG